ncbi:hypothetical protein F480_04285 [Bibersteinia trehalosi Y31]|uniref:CDP-glycerol:poly(Glycerophosphate) glycerophosphotransferase n=1 Tax=Bibersteinia trehalosi Y31 TaxID=1261658 RepID=A0A179D201_BIBTR|nr:CDP-glycerol glycerophosphotransferase family protein [Bibersteinia trehalosi]OAQ15838.1 hypothetical protein F480_04285 [Bibersteinia trehalosi Y31]
MSKLTKLIKHPIMFFKDAFNKKTSPIEIGKDKSPKKVVINTKSKKEKSKMATKKEFSNKKNSEKEVAKIADNKLFANVRFKDDIAIYFDGKMGNLYQVEQWLGPFKALAKERDIVFIVRVKEVFDWISNNTEFPVVYCKVIDEVMKVYEEGKFKCVLYVNNGQKNFQSLIISDVYHVHINHGESDKLSTISNQAKAYDYVFISGQAAYDKYNNNLINKDMNKFIKIGRPQLEHIEKIECPDINKPNPASSYNVPNRKVVLYAPTWEATYESMNYTSLNDFGMKIIDEVMAQDDLFLIYKPHPNTGSRDPQSKLINEQIINKLKKYYKGKAITSGDINSLYEHVDIAIFDNSAVAIDYLATDKPMLMTDMFYRTPFRNDKPIITTATKLVSEDNINNLINILRNEIKNDTVSIERKKVKEYFLGNIDYKNGESTRMFIDQISLICDERDYELELLKEKLND